MCVLLGGIRYVLLDSDVMDVFFGFGIMVVNPINPLSTAPEIEAQVAALKDHPGLLMYSLGNEWNYNGLYASRSPAEAAAAVRTASEAIRTVDPHCPIATIYGEVPTAALVESLPCIDVWGLNVYRSDTFGDLFGAWEGISTKPLFLGEFGADAFNALPEVNAYDPGSQAEATERLGTEINSNSVLYSQTGVASGGFVFEWADEYWKAGDNWAQDTGGVAPGGGPFPDSTFNEEYWGLVTIDRQTRPAYAAYAALRSPPAWPHIN